MYALVDCNTFYASCEQIFRPDLWDAPVAVLSNNDGCIIARNARAKALGIPDMVPFFQVRDQVEARGVHVFSSNYELYGDISARVMRLLEPWAEALEVYSIDEAFLRLHYGDYQARGWAIRAMLWKTLRMPVCVGIAPTKTLAKLANHAAKKIPKLNGVCVLDSTARREWLLQRVPPGAVWGVGRRISTRLHALGIRDALALARSDPKWLRRHFSVVLEKTVRELGGAPCLDLELDSAPRKEIVCTRSFSYKVTRLEELQQAVSLYAARACEKLRRQDGLTTRIWVYVESFDKSVGYYFRQDFITLPHLSNDTRLIAARAARAIAGLYRPGLRYKKCGIGLLDVRTRKYEQQDLFASRQGLQSRQLMRTLDRINQRYGRHTVTLASAGLNPPWAMRRDFKSPAYTTRWNDIPVVKC